MDDLKRAFAQAYGIRTRGKTKPIIEEPEEMLLDEEPLMEPELPAEEPEPESRQSLVAKIISKHKLG